MRRKWTIVRIFVAALSLVPLYSVSVGSAQDGDSVPDHTVIQQTEHVVILQVQTGTTASAASELVLLYNPTESPVHITDYCLFYASASAATTRQIVCVEPVDDTTELWLDAGGIVSFASSQFLLDNPEFIADFVLSSGMSSTAGHVYVLDAAANEVDRVGWGASAVQPETAPTTTHIANETISRDATAVPLDTDDNSVDFSSMPLLQMIESGVYEQEIIIDLCANIDGIQQLVPAGYGQDEIGDCYLDVCPDLDGLQVEIPDGYEKLEGSGVCTLIPLEDAVIFITELLPNAPSVDTGLEFIELYNPNQTTVNLQNYVIQVGPSFTKQHVLVERSIDPLSYITLSDVETGITLPNTNGVQLRLYAPAGNLVSESAIYSNADDDVSWALIEDQWIYTNQITPAAANKPYLEPAVDEVLGVTSVLAPCPAGKFRNPATNRCKTIETAVSQLAPCDEDEFRNPETNRCKKLSSASTSQLTPCDEGEERNPETNRCRKIVASGATGSDDGLPLITDVVPTASDGSVNWPIMLGALFATAGYMAYEWRVELLHAYGRLQRRVVQ